MVIQVIAVVPLENPFHFMIATTYFGTFLLRNITALFAFAFSLAVSSLLQMGCFRVCRRRVTCTMRIEFNKFAFACYIFFRYINTVIDMLISFQTSVGMTVEIWQRQMQLRVSLQFSARFCTTSGELVGNVCSAIVLCNLHGFCRRTNFHEFCMVGVGTGYDALFCFFLH